MSDFNLYTKPEILPERTPLVIPPTPVASRSTNNDMILGLIQAMIGQGGTDPNAMMQFMRQMGIGRHKNYISDAPKTSAPSLTPDDVWNRSFKTANQRAQVEADRLGIPLGMTTTGQEMQQNSLPASERMNRNMGFTPDMTMEQRRQILADRTSARTGRPVADYLPRDTSKDPVTYKLPNGSTGIDTPEGQTVGWTNPWATATSGSIDGKSLTPQRQGQAEAQAHQDLIDMWNQSTASRLPGANFNDFVKNPGKYPRPTNDRFTSTLPYRVPWKVSDFVK